MRPLEHHLKKQVIARMTESTCLKAHQSRMGGVGEIEPVRARPIFPRVHSE